MSNDNTKIWFTTPSILLKKEYITQIWPTKNMSRDEKLNAISRLVIILSV